MGTDRPDVKSVIPASEMCVSDEQFSKYSPSDCVLPFALFRLDHEGVLGGVPCYLVVKCHATADVSC